MCCSAMVRQHPTVRNRPSSSPPSSPTTRDRSWAGTAASCSTSIEQSPGTRTVTAASAPFATEEHVSERGLGSLVADRKIGTKVGVGFLSVLAILAVSSVTAYTAFQTAGDGFRTYAQRVGVVGIARDLDRTFLNMRRFVREYVFTAKEANIEPAKREAEAVRSLLRKGLDEVKNPERHRRLEEIAGQFEAYAKDFDGVITLNREQTTLLEETLDP